MTPAQHDCAAIVQRSAEGLLTVLNDILDFSKMEAGKLDLQTRDFPLRKEIQDVRVYSPQPTERNSLTMSCEIDTGVPRSYWRCGSVSTDLANLLSNAIKFTDRGRSRFVLLRSAR